MNNIRKPLTFFTLFYFSGSGNTEILARTLADRLEERGHTVEAVKIPDFLRKNRANAGERLRRIIEGEGSQKGAEHCEKSHLVLLYPVYAFDAPTIVYDFLRKFPSPSRVVSASIIFSPCDPHPFNSAATFKVRRKLEQKGYAVLREDMVVMPSNFVIGYPKALAVQLIKTAEKKLAEISLPLREGCGSRVAPRPIARVLRLIFKIEHLGAIFFGKDLKAGPACTLCGLCAAECPSENIRIENGRVRFGWSCILCMRCLYRCPVNAIAPRIHRFIPIKGGYQPEEITGLTAGEDFVTEETAGFYAHFWEYLSGESLKPPQGSR